MQQCMKDLTHQWSILHWEISPTYGIKTEAENALCEAMGRVREWITEGRDKGNTSIQGVVRGLEAGTWPWSWQERE